MQLSLLNKIRIAASFAIGIILIGILAWPLAAPVNPYSAVTFANMSTASVVLLVILAFFVGLLAYFVCWPVGREIGIFAVPAGLAVWALRSGSIANLIQLNPNDLGYRLQVYASIKWDSFFWLLIVAFGLAGVLLGQKMVSRKSQKNQIAEAKQDIPKSRLYLNIIITLIFSAFLAQLLIRIFAQAVHLDSMVSQPSSGQIAFAVIVAFCASAFIVKKFLDVSYIWPALASVFIIPYAVIAYAKTPVLGQFCSQLPAVFFPNALISVLPIQVVSFGTLGAVAGYWLAIRYNYWREFET